MKMLKPSEALYFLADAAHEALSDYEIADIIENLSMPSRNQTGLIVWAQEFFIGMNETINRREARSEGWL